MPILLTCPMGHQWETPDDPSDSATLTPACPICRTSEGRTVAWHGSDTNPPLDSHPQIWMSGLTQPVAGVAAATGPCPAIEGYEILEAVGRGGMGVVYKARHLRLKRLVALKMIRAGAGADDQERARFRTEAEAAARLQHPGIVQIYEVGEQNGQPFLALEFADGGSLSRALAGQVLQAGPAAELVEALSRAMHYAHQRGVIHRDLKPGNVMLSGPASAPPNRATPGTAGIVPLTSPKITDFGLAKHLDDDGDQTRTGQILGTPSYMAPEQASGNSQLVGPSADVYALGAILYELVTGRPPFRAATPLETLEQVRTQEPVSPHRLQPGLPRDLETICLKCLQKSPGERYASAVELADDLKRFVHGEPIHARPVGPANRLWRWCRRKPGLASLSAALLIVAVTSFVAVTFLWRTSEAHRRRAELQSASLAYDHGQTIAEQGDVGRGMLLMARALTDVPAGGEDLRRAIRSSLSGWSRQVRPMRGMFAHESLVGASVFSPDGKLIAVADLGGVVRFWDPATGERVGPPLEHSRGVGYPSFCLEGRFLFTASGDGLRRWDVRTGKVQGSVFGPDQGIFNGLAVSPDGRTVYAGLKAGPNGEDAPTFRGWDIATGEPRGEPVVLSGPGSIGGICISPDGQLLAISLSNQTSIQVFEFSNPRSPSLVLKLENAQQAIFSSDSRRLLTGIDRHVRVWNARTGEPVEPPLAHSADVSSMACSPDGTLLATVSMDGAVRLWDLETHSPLGAPLEFGDYVPRNLSFHPEGNLLLTSGYNRAARLWDVGSARASGRTLAHEANITCIAVSPDGRVIVTGSQSAANAVRLWDAASRMPLDVRVRTAGTVRTVAMGSDGRTFFAGGGGAQLFDTATGEPVGPLFLANGSVSTVAVSPDGKTLLTGTFRNEVQRWDAATGRPIGEPLQHPGELRALAFRHDGTVFLTGCDQRSLRLWDTVTGEPSGPSFDVPSAVLAAAFSPDGRTIIAGLADKTARLFDVATGKPRGPAMRHENVVMSVAFSPDGRLILTGSFDATARLWDAETGKLLGPPLKSEGPVWTVAFTPDGRTALTGGDDKQVRFWNVPVAVDEHDDQISRWVQVLTGQELDDNGAVRDLDAATWWRQKRRIEEQFNARTPDGGPSE